MAEHWTGEDDRSKDQLQYEVTDFGDHFLGKMIRKETQKSNIMQSARPVPPACRLVSS